MSNLSIAFSNPWLLFLLVPALFLTLWPYFRLSRKYRKTRNRITSMVLHMLIMVLAVSVLAGARFNYEIPNHENEVIFLLDSSYSNRQSDEKKDEFIQSVLDNGNGVFKMTVVTFGKNVVETGEFSSDAALVYSNYKNSQQPDLSATDIDSALLYAAEMFNTPEAAKIVLVSDGIETDGEARPSVARVVAKGITVDTVYFPDDYDSEVMITSVVHSASAVLVGVPVEFDVTLRTDISENGLLVLSDNGIAQTSETTHKPVSIIFRPNDENIFKVSHTFTSPGLHRIKMELLLASNTADSMTENNSYHTYIDIQIHSRILVVDGKNANSVDESTELMKILDDQNYQKLDKIDLASVPADIDYLLGYDEIILVNTAVTEVNADLQLRLQEYVEIYGGGLFTVGGDKAYDHENMKGTTLQSILPVDASPYAPPIAVVIIIDRSASMGQVSTYKEGTKTFSKLEVAKKGAIAAVELLNPQDFCAVVTLEDSYSLTMDITPATKRNSVITEINRITTGSSTVYFDAIDFATTLLLKVSSEVEYKHILFVSDGGPSDNENTFTNLILKNNRENDITLSSMFIGAPGDTESAAGIMRKMALDYGGGRFYDGKLNPDKIVENMSGDVTVEQRKQINTDPFTPTIRDASHHTVNGIESLPQMGGFYGVRTKRINKRPVEVSLTALNNVPLYAEWSVGKGRVGSFMSDLSGVTGSHNGNWSQAFVASEEGKLFINNVVRGLMPSTSVTPNKLVVDIDQKNYYVGLTISPKIQLETGDRIQVEVKALGTSQQQGSHFLDYPTLPAIDASQSGISVTSRFSFGAPGVYEIAVSVLRGTTVVENNTQYASFAYSSEYNPFIDEEAVRQSMAGLAQAGKGKSYGTTAGSSHSAAVSAASRAVLEEISVTMPRQADPTIVFITLAVAMFLLDIAVRKFKFKWPWEIVRDRKIKQELNKTDKKTTSVG